MTRAILHLALLALLAAGASGCGTAWGSAYVGQWRAQKKIDYVYCLEDERGNCTPPTVVSHEVPARRFFGVDIAYPAIGAAYTQHGDESRVKLRFEPSLEVLKGKGNWAFGVRAGALLELGDHSFGAVSVNGLVHRGISERYAIYAGAGYLPYVQVKEGKDAMPETSYVGFRGLAGAHVVLRKSISEFRIFLAVEGDVTYTLLDDDDYRSVGLQTRLTLSF
jgi:hypothetical protein